MLSTTLELYLFTLIIYAGLSVVGAPASRLLRLPDGHRLVLRPVLGAVIIEVVAWYVLDISSVGLHVVFPWLTGGALLATVGLRFRLHPTSTSAGPSSAGSSERHATVRPLVLVAVVTTATFTFHASSLLRLGHLTVASLGNNDLPAYAAVARHISSNGFSDAGWISQNHLGDFARTDVSGMYSLLSHATWITGRGEWEIGLPVLLLASVLLAQALCLLLLRTTPLGGAAAALLSAIGINTFLFTYVSWHYFISQLFAMVALPLIVYLLLQGAADLGRRRTQLLLAALVAHLLLVYPHMAILLVPASAAIALIGQGSTVALRQRAIDIVRLLGVGGLLGVLLLPTRFIVSVERIVEVGEGIAGWALAGVLPWALIGFQTSFRSTATSGVILASTVLIIESLASWQRRRRRHEAGTFPFLGIGAVAFLPQGIFYFLRDNSYEHWKWISFFQPLLTLALLAPFALGLATWSRRSGHALLRQAVPIVLCLLLAAVVGNARVATRALAEPGRSVWVDTDLAGLANARALADIEAIDIAAGPWWNSMWAVVLLEPKTVNLLHTDTYYFTAPPSAGTTLIETSALEGVTWLDPTRLNQSFALIPSMPSGPTSTEFAGLDAAVVVSLSTGQGVGVEATIEVTNTGTTNWLGGRNSSRGEVNIGVQALDGNRNLIDADYLRLPLVAWPLWVPPGATVLRSFGLTVRPPDGTQVLKFVPVAEQVAWFDGLGTVPVEVGRPEPNSTNGALLAAETTGSLKTNDDGTVTISYEITNTGEAHWLGGAAGIPGEVNIGVQPLDDKGNLLATDYFRIPLVPWPASVAPGTTISGNIELASPAEEIRYFRLLPVAERIAWFEAAGPGTDYVAIDAADAHKLLVPPGHNSTDPAGLAADVTVELRQGEGDRLLGSFTVTNTGSSTWLGSRDGSAGEVKLGVQALGDDLQPVELDYLRIPLGPLNIEPGQTVDGQFALPSAIPEGTRLLRFLPMAEYIAWFSPDTTTPFDVGDPQPNSRKTDLLEASTTANLHLAEDGSLRLEYSVTNTGGAHWIGSHANQPGEVNLGVQALDANGNLLDRDLHRISLVHWPDSIAPGQAVKGSTNLPALPDGAAFLRLVPVAEQVAWFDDLGSIPEDVAVLDAIPGSG